MARVVGILPQSPIAPEGITVGDLVGRGRYPHQGWFRQWSAADDAAVTDALMVTSSLELVERRMEELSGGQQQRVWIAMALAQDPDILLLDEPTTGLDPQARHILWDRLFRLKEQGTTLVLTTHYMDEAEQLCDRLIVVDKGRIMAEGTPASLIREHSSREVLEVRFGSERNA
ncbi:MAG: ABC transporter ATP-binding protein, partial [Rhodococcus sp. (in: high G+C Gram-positive bacteria)]